VSVKTSVPASAAEKKNRASKGDGTIPISTNKEISSFSNTTNNMSNTCNAWNSTKETQLSKIAKKDLKFEKEKTFEAEAEPQVLDLLCVGFTDETTFKAQLSHFFTGVKMSVRKQNLISKRKNSCKYLIENTSLKIESELTMSNEYSNNNSNSNTEDSTSSLCFVKFRKANGNLIIFRKLVSEFIMRMNSTMKS